MIEIERVIPLGNKTFEVTIVTGSEKISSLCRMVMAEVAGEDPIEKIEFDSDDFQKLIMLGELSLKDIVRAIVATQS